MYLEDEEMAIVKLGIDIRVRKIMDDSSGLEGWFQIELKILAFSTPTKR